jgi:hypothetical protein
MLPPSGPLDGFNECEEEEWEEDESTCKDDRNGGDIHDSSNPNPACDEPVAVRAVAVSPASGAVVLEAPRPRLQRKASVEAKPTEDKPLVGVNVSHPTHGRGKVVAIDMNDTRGKPYTVLFDNGESHQ